MRVLENTARFQQAQSDVMQRFSLLNKLLWDMWSKRTHGDIFALVQVARNLSKRGPDVRAAVNTVEPRKIRADSMLQSATGFMLSMLSALVEEFGVDVRQELSGMIREFGDLQLRDKPTIEAATAEFRRMKK